LGKRAKAIGNIGDAACNYAHILGKNDTAVIECSSYQLESVVHFKPNIAILSNLGFDHIEHHQTYENYIAAKLKIFQNMTASDFAIINYDDPASMQFTIQNSQFTMSDETLKNSTAIQHSAFSIQHLSKIAAKKYYFSVNEPVDRGVFLRHGKFYFIDKKCEYICSVNDIKLFGKHNHSNVAACICAAKILKVSNRHIMKILKDFGGVEHRLEYVKTVNGKSIFNDSKSTNSESCLAACNAFSQSITLILGGQKSDENYEKMFAVMPHNVKDFVLFGETAELFARILKKQGKDFVKCACLEEVVEKSLSYPNEIILFSPACKSYDMFDNFEHRGKEFKRVVGEW